jgi:hypothetical protein
MVAEGNLMKYARIKCTSGALGAKKNGTRHVQSWGDMKGCVLRVKQI